MYEAFFGLTEKPFSIQPDPSFLYWGRGHRLAYAMLEYGVVNQAGISVITGEIGCGKTTLIHRLLEQLSDTHTVALLSNIQAGRGDLLSWVLMGFGEPFSGKTHVEMFALLQAFFIREYGKGRRVVLIIDEAQNLSVDMLEEIRMLSNINAGKDQLLQLILVGQPQLKDLLSRPDMLQLAQRIGSDFHLTPLSREEVHAYIETRLTIAGAQHSIFAARAMDLMAEQSRGVPRVINIIADTALVYAFSAQDEVVDEDVVRTVIRDKLDYGVFGLASSPDLKLSESREQRAASGFLREAPKAPPAETMPEPEPEPLRRPPRRAAESGPRVVTSLGVSFATPEPAAPEPALVARQPAYEAGVAAAARMPAPVAAPTPVEELEAPDYEALTATRGAAEPEPAPVAAPEPVSAKQIGVVVVGLADGEGVRATARSAPHAAALVGVVAPAAAGAARDAGIEPVELDAGAVGGGRARNAGYRRLKKIAPDLRYVQFVAAGELVDPAWLDAAARFMARRPEVAALDGRTLETTPAKSLWRRIADFSHAAEEGETQTTGATALFRTDAFEAAGGFRGDIIADETADLCIRLRRRGAHVWRTDAVMALVEPKKMTFAEWRRQATRDGFGYAAGAALHGAPPERYAAAEQTRAVMWGAVFPAVVLIGAALAGISTEMFTIGGNPFLAALGVVAVGLLVYAAKIVVTAIALGPARPFSWSYAAASTLAHFYECAGVFRYWFGDRRREAAA